MRNRMIVFIFIALGSSTGFKPSVVFAANKSNAAVEVTNEFRIAIDLLKNYYLPFILDPNNKLEEKCFFVGKYNQRHDYLSRLLLSLYDESHDQKIYAAFEEIIKLNVHTISFCESVASTNPNAVPPHDVVAMEQKLNALLDTLKDTRNYVLDVCKEDCTP